MMKRISVLFTCSLLSSVASFAQDAAKPMPQLNDPYFKIVTDELNERLQLKPNTGRAKNVILMIGDGMGLSTITAGRIYEGQKRGVDGEMNQLVFEKLPYTALSKTFSSDSQVTDSAPSATAMTTGVKTKNGVIGLNSEAIYNDCASGKGKEVTTIFEQAVAMGKATGFVTTTRITHATPAAGYAHTANRDWEDDAAMKDQAGKGCTDIADQLINWGKGDGPEIAMGGGRAAFFPNTVDDPEDKDKKGNRKDGRNLVEEWTKKSNNNVYVYDKAGLDKIDLKSGPKVLALFDRSHMQYEIERAKDKAGEPSLAEMTKFAIDRLSQNKEGYVLMVEGGRIDHAHHENSAIKALEDVVAFDDAVKTALDMTKREDTLVIVTADHSHVFNINGYSKRGTPILGLSIGVDGKTALAADGKPYTTLSYANGPSAVFPKTPKEGEPAPAPVTTRPDLSHVDTTALDYMQASLVPMESETHGGEDVAIYAIGPMAHLVSGTVLENYIYQVMAYASGLGPKKP